MLASYFYIYELIWNLILFVPINKINHLAIFINIMKVVYLLSILILALGE